MAMARSAVAWVAVMAALMACVCAAEVADQAPPKPPVVPNQYNFGTLEGLFLGCFRVGRV